MGARAFGSLRHRLSSVQPQTRQTPLVFFGIAEPSRWRRVPGNNITTRPTIRVDKPPAHREVTSFAANSAYTPSKFLRQLAPHILADLQRP
jgi:hypothetical protein